MLILSRSEGEAVAFPDLNIAVKILRLAGSRVRVGIEAPSEIRVLRSELSARADETLRCEESAARRHRLRNQLNTVNLALTVAQRHLESGDTAAAEVALGRAFKQLAAADSELNAPPASANDAKPAPPAPVPAGAKVLLVDDNENELSLLAELLRISGFQVRVAHNGEEAIQEMERDLPAVVLLDMQMPICDGPTAVQRIRADHRYDQVALYAVTGTTPTEGQVKESAIDMEHWFQKPVKADALVQAIRNETASSISC